MTEKTKIEWADHTFNPWEGCQKVGPGCDHCYAETRNARFAGGVAVNWGPGAPRRRTSAANWRKPLAWNAAHAAFYATHGHRQRVFCASLADVFDNEVDPEWRADLFRLIEATPNLDWLLLTKRIGNVGNMLPVPFDFERMYPNVWLGATITSQAEADRDIPKLLEAEVKVKFLSMEPLLGPVDFYKSSAAWSERGYTPWLNRPILGGIDWVIVGGESGVGARPIYPDWARGLRDQCSAAGVPFLFKQWGEWAPGECAVNTLAMRKVDVADYFGGDWKFDTIPGGSEFHIDDEPALYRAGKRAAGRALDGLEYNGFPEVK